MNDEAAEIVSGLAQGESIFFVFQEILQSSGKLHGKRGIHPNHFFNVKLEKGSFIRSGIRVIRLSDYSQSPCKRFYSPA